MSDTSSTWFKGVVYEGETHKEYGVRLHDGDIAVTMIPKHDAVTLDITAGKLKLREKIDIEIADWWLEDRGLL